VNSKEYTDLLIGGGIGIIATDTIYGIIGQALKPATVQRIYTVKRRTPTKPFIILISNLLELGSFGITIDETVQTAASTYWPGPVSIIIDCPHDDFEYLHRGTKTLAFRMPAKPELHDLITLTGPLVAPSANPEGFMPSATIDEAKAYFTDEVDFYNEGIVRTKPSKIIRITDGREEIIRA
jgi:L-threonylcarbamoyladenylate synthase